MNEIQSLDLVLTNHGMKNTWNKKKFGSKHVWIYLSITNYVTIEKTIYVWF